ncbi:MAG TPA: TIGR03790 family protein [Fimbriimonadaceae bacterium]|nr:TIGR03790 family protein [Fimbriimonadaceae bacterium]HRE94636.1 TIGR03790 family protein [Fimbriimonadaceae bacterium]
MAKALLLVGLGLGWGCSPAPSEPSPAPSTTTSARTANPDTRRVVVVINTKSPDSQAVGAYYMDKRGIPADAAIHIACPPGEEISRTDFDVLIATPVREKIKQLGRRTDFVVLTQGVPIRIGDKWGPSVDSMLAGVPSPIKPITTINAENVNGAVHPYFQADEPFNSEKYSMWLVTRLSGPTVADAKALVDRSLKAEAGKGPFLFDQAANRNTEDYARLQTRMSEAVANLNRRGFQAELDEKPAFAAPGQPLMGYVSWGSNDGAFRADAYRQIKFKPGAIAETFVSTSARTFGPAQGGQSLIADLIRGGVTGVKGYVSEPYTFAMADPQVLFDRYTRGYTLAESFYAASPILKWKDLVIGDPICRPYPQKPSETGS